jgi:alkanesulfonate monooxygenase SsuD/methylene tetrahydromethanopterin reductase-like flavin-dependent oxidoreductase (luciferase family)
VPKRNSIQAWVSLPWAGPTAYYGADARGLVQRLEGLGITGVIQGDHPFVPGAALPFAAMAADCLTVLTTVAAHAERLKVASLVANIGIQHPYLVLRKFAHLALLHGGARVYAGIGGGWAAPDFEALGLEMPPAPLRLERLEEAARLARGLFDDGVASVNGGQVVADNIPLAPRPDVPPRLLLGGGSRRLLELAGRYADHVDISPPPRVRAENVFQQKLLTTVNDLVDSAGQARDAADAAGRGRESLTTSILLANVVFCPAGDIRAEEEAACAAVGLPWRSLDACPFALIGEPARIAEQVRELQERIGLDWIVLPRSEVERFATDVMPLLA